MAAEIQDIKDRLNIVDIVGEYVELKKMGMNHKACCPFHSEKTPSFVVSEEKQIFRCFGCDKGGDMFTFIQEIDGIEFRQALELLAKRAGVELKRQDPKELSRKERALEVLSLANEFFRQGYLKSTSGRVAREYVERRGIPEILQQKFSIGYSPDSFSILSSFLLKRGFTKKEITEAGLAVSKPDGSGYDRFRNRLMFPISNVQGFVVGFGARLLEKNDNAPKYLNSPETKQYNKSRILYGLDLAKSEARKKKAIIVVEGYMDVIASHKAGVENVVASSGTALTDEQIQLMARYADTIYLSFDMDSAGEQATRRGVEKLLKSGLDIRIITLSGGKDPDELVKENPEAWPKAIENAKPLIDHYVSKINTEVDLTDARAKSAAAKDISELISYLPDAIEREHYSKQLAEVLQVSHESIVAQMPAHKKVVQPRREEISIQQSQQRQPQQKSDTLTESRRQLFAMLMMRPELVGETPGFVFEKGQDELIDWLAPFIKSVYTEGQHNSVYFFTLIEKEDAEKANQAKQLVLTFEHSVLTSAPDTALAVIRPIFDKSLQNLKRISLKKKIEELSHDMRQAEIEHRHDDVEKLAKVFDVLTKELMQIN